MLVRMLVHCFSAVAWVEPPSASETAGIAANAKAVTVIAILVPTFMFYLLEIKGFLPNRPSGVPWAYSIANGRGSPR